MEVSQGARRKNNEHLYRLSGSLWSWWSSLIVQAQYESVNCGARRSLRSRQQLLTEHLDPRSKEKRSRLRRKLEENRVSRMTVGGS